MSGRKRLIPFLVMLAVALLYYGIPVVHNWYLTQKQEKNMSGLVLVQTGSIGANTGDIVSSIHDTTNDVYQSFITKELPKLTKQTRALLDQYNNEDKDPRYLFDLVNSLNDDGAYYTAIYLYQILLKEYPDKATYSSYLKLLLNRGEYTPQFLSEYQHTIDLLSLSGLITKQDSLFFTACRTLISGDVDTFYQVVHQLTGDYAPIASDLLKNVTTYSQYKQAPQQYLWGLFASTLLRHGYYAPAIHLAQQSLKFNPDYILGLQVSAYGNIMIHEWDTAKSYLTKLMSLDSEHLITYQRLYGIASYWDNEHKDTVRYLSQVHDKIPNVELLRYIGLSYRALYDYMHVAKTYRSILESQQLNEIDYFEFFDTYRRSVSYYSGMTFTGQINPIDQYDNLLLTDYITHCGSSITGDQQYLCEYGKALQLLFDNNVDEAIDLMISIARNHPYDFVYGMIGDMYIIKNKTPTAQLYYQRAIDSSYNGGYQRYLSHKIKELTIDGSETN